VVCPEARRRAWLGCLAACHAVRFALHVPRGPRSETHKVRVPLLFSTSVRKPEPEKEPALPWNFLYNAWLIESWLRQLSTTRRMTSGSPHRPRAGGKKGLETTRPAEFANRHPHRPRAGGLGFGGSVARVVPKPPPTGTGPVGRAPPARNPVFVKRHPTGTGPVAKGGSHSPAAPSPSLQLKNARCRSERR
jgi:hypothetical protein